MLWPKVLETASSSTGSSRLSSVVCMPRVSSPKATSSRRSRNRCWPADQEHILSFSSTTYRVLIASPSDMPEERQIATEGINEWNALHASDEGVVLLPVKWETHAMPETGVRPQAAINRQLVAECDLLLGMFWSKLGTSTGVAESGTVEEI